MFLDFINDFNKVIAIFFAVCFFHQTVYIPVSLLMKARKFKAKKLNRFAVVIAARNESEVIAQLINSVKSQKYPQELVDTIVIADNCDDNTAQIARDMGAIVYERNNKKVIGKGHALDFMFKDLIKQGSIDNYDGFFVFDADNILDPEYINEMNKTFDNGYRIITSYRNSKNYDTNWISAGYSLWFLREARFLNNARMLLGTGCAISGTGFLVHKEIIAKNNGWKHFLLTEDIEFTTESTIEDEMIGYCPTARFYDEQPVTFKQSWNQRLRWAKGAYQVFAKYAHRLVGGLIKNKNFACFDMLTACVPAAVMSVVSLLANAIFLIIGICTIHISPNIFTTTLHSFGELLMGTYNMMFLIGLLTTITEWKQIHCSTLKKIFFLFTFPIFMFTYMPIAVVAMFKKIEWKPIKHTMSKNLDDIKQI